MKSRRASQTDFSLICKTNIVSSPTYQIKLPQFEGPFDLLLFFIERDELDIYNIPITKIIKDFLQYIHEQEKAQYRAEQRVYLLVSTLMRIKAKMLLPRKRNGCTWQMKLTQGKELVDKILEYKRFKEASIKWLKWKLIACSWSSAVTRRRNLL